MSLWIYKILIIPYDDLMQDENIWFFQSIWRNEYFYWCYIIFLLSKLSKLLTSPFDFTQFSTRFIVSLNFCFLIWNGHRNSNCAFVRVVVPAGRISLCATDSAVDSDVRWDDRDDRYDATCDDRDDRCDATCDDRDASFAIWTVVLWLSLDTSCLHRNTFDWLPELDLNYSWRTNKLTLDSSFVNENSKLSRLMKTSWKQNHLKCIEKLK